MLVLTLTLGGVTEPLKNQEGWMDVHTVHSLPKKK